MERKNDELYSFLSSLELMQYYESFKREGFDRLEAIADIQESDFEALGVKRGHRRIIHRRAQELTSPLRYSRDLPPITSPLLSQPHLRQPSQESAPSPPLDEAEPLTAYLYRQHPQLQQQQQSRYPPPPLQYPRHQQQQYHQQQQHLWQQQQQQFQQRQTIPFPKPSQEGPSKHAGKHPAYHTVHTSAISRPVPVSTQPTIQIPSTSPSYQPQAPQYSQQQPASLSSAESPSLQQPPRPTSPFTSPYQISPIAAAIRTSPMRHKSRGLSMSSLVGSSSSRRRSSRSDPRSPYARPSTDPQSPQSPKSPASPQSPKRTYRRHPKKDPNAPEKWRSAYQLFRDDVNRELHGQEIPFSEMSKIHSRKWAELDEEKKEVYFERSRSDKAEYQRKMAIYEQTPEYRQYEEYLEKFYKQDSTVKRVGRPKGTRTSKSKGKSADVGRSQEQEHDLDPSTTKSQESPSSSQEISSR